MESPAASPRRRFQFRLRTLMVVVTLFALIPCGYLGCQAKIVRQRKAMIQKLTGLEGAYVAATEVANLRRHFGLRETLTKLPWIREWLGDESVYGLYIPRSVSELDAEEIAIAFPEAIVSEGRVFPMQK